ncbi:DUF349 domain-containing protein [Longivirga aurantiaca]|uniref:DUF349 domain-containing protein n=1 Tax=Longivirga aurantiaca TaxID=1837743 RepID=A0ABW1T1B1_9ACTN
MSDSSAPEGTEQTTPDEVTEAVEAVEAAPDAPDAAAAPEAEAAEAPVEEPLAEPAAVEEPVAEPAAVEEPVAEPAAVEAAPPMPAVEAAPEQAAVEAAPPMPAVEAAPEQVEAEAAADVPAAQAPAAEAPGAAAPAAEAPAPEAPSAEAPSAEAPAAAPKPSPRPSPAALAGSVRPAPPRPVATGAATPAPVAAPEPEVHDADRPTDSATFGRIDDDGNVHVALHDGSEHVVGQWAAGTPDEGLAFFVRKFDDLSVEVSLATRRLTEGKASPEQAGAVVKRALESLESPTMVGDLASLRARVAALDSLVQEKRAAAAEVRAAAKAAALAAREAIVAEAEALAESTQWKASGERFKELLDEWKAAPRADRTGEQALWKRFSHARSQFDKHRRQHFARLDGERGEAKQVKESLVAEAEALKSSTDWGNTASAYRDLMSRWKAAGRAGKTDEEELWQRFRAAQDEFFAARNAELGKRDAGFAENLAAKEALLAEAEAINTSDLKSAKTALRSIQERWESIGHVPRGDKERIEGRLRRVEDAVRKGEQDQWKRTNPEAKARADATVEQFGASLAKLEKEHAKLVAAGDARKAADVEGRIATTKTLLEAAERAAAEFSG